MHLSGKRGVALIITLWVLVLLSILALGFSSAVRRESKSARNFKEDILARLLAVSAYEETLCWLASDPEPDIDYLDEEGVFRTDGEREPISGVRETESSVVEINVSDEEARLNLNLIKDYMLRRLLELSGANEENIPEMVDAFLDWRDRDDMHHLHGAEEEYYEPLGYLPKNGPLDSPEELFLIKGFDKKALEGSGEGKSPILPLLTTWGQRINVNTVGTEVLEVLGVDPLDIESLMSSRASMKGLKILPRWRDPNNGTTRTAFYRVEIKARLIESPQTVTITAVVKRRAGKDGEELVTVYWKEGRETGSS